MLAEKTLKIENTDSKVSFSIKKLGLITVNGTISDLDGQINFYRKDLMNSFLIFV